jgi:hypothetical protein
MTSVPKEEQKFRTVKALIKKGPSLRDLELALTDPKPLGCHRETKFQLDRFIHEGDCREGHRMRSISSVINAIIRGMARLGDDRHGFLNNYYWRITGGTEMGQFGSLEKGGVDFTIENYSPITRKGEIYFYIPE